MSDKQSIISWNVNGLRALERKGQFDWLIKRSPDIFCLQETKSREDQLSADVRGPEGYHSYFSWPTEKKGYSGVAIYSKEEPEDVEEGIGVKVLDQEGRTLIAHFPTFSLINTYFPNGGGGPERLKYKLEYYKAFLKKLEKLRKTQPNIIFCGDVNTAHAPVDLARPKENEKNTGFLPEERAWIDAVIQKGWVDVFREKHPHVKDAYTYWDMKTRARDRNVGWRIDYFFVAQEMMKHVSDVRILDDVLGSDHCPVELVVRT